MIQVKITVRCDAPHCRKAWRREDFIVADAWAANVLDYMPDGWVVIEEGERAYCPQHSEER